MKKKQVKDIVFEKVQTSAIDFNFSFVMDDINEKEELVFYLNKNTSSYSLHFDCKTEIFTVKVMGSRFYSGSDKFYKFPSMELCMECISALDFYYEQILSHVKNF